jgi:hypothetical protein
MKICRSPSNRCLFLLAYYAAKGRSQAVRSPIRLIILSPCRLTWCSCCLHCVCVLWIFVLRVLACLNNLVLGSHALLGSNPSSLSIYCPDVIICQLFLWHVLGYYSGLMELDPVVWFSAMFCHRGLVQLTQTYMSFTFSEPYFNGSTFCPIYSRLALCEISSW